jgi:transcriptional regulator with XRE-family HTH domain
VRTNMLGISGILKELRAKKGESLQQVADAVGVSKAHIWEIEKGTSQNPSINLLQGLADHFGVSVASLIGEQPQLADDEAHAFYRSVRTLSKRDREVLQTVIDGMNASRRGG